MGGVIQGKRVTEGDKGYRGGEGLKRWGKRKTIVLFSFLSTPCL